MKVNDNQWGKEHIQEVWEANSYHDHTISMPLSVNSYLCSLATQLSFYETVITISLRMATLGNTLLLRICTTVALSASDYYFRWYHLGE